MLNRTTCCGSKATAAKQKLAVRPTRIKLLLQEQPSLCCLSGSAVCTVVSFSWMQMMMFSVPSEPYELSPVKVRALELFMILHMDHEQNASTSTVRTAGAVLDHASRCKNDEI